MSLRARACSAQGEAAIQRHKAKLEREAKDEATLRRAATMLLWKVLSVTVMPESFDVKQIELKTTTYHSSAIGRRKKQEYSYTRQAAETRLDGIALAVYRDEAGYHNGCTYRDRYVLVTYAAKIDRWTSVSDLEHLGLILKSDGRCGTE